ncbi:MAG: M13 family metallopeptidase [Kofleriaceae bacterium]|nr:M13 family metallopeptidase [Kofleriaceae bacterium]
MTNRSLRVSVLSKFLGVGAISALVLGSCGPKTPAGGTGPDLGAGSGGATAGDGSAGAGADPGAGAGSSTTPAPPPAGAVNVSLADVGLEPDSLDRKADPCVDFYQFACGGWLSKTEIPADRSRYARFTEIDDRNEQLLRQIMDDSAAGKVATPVGKKIGDYFASCMDEAAIEKSGLAGIKKLQAQVGKVRDAKTWFAAVVALHKLGIPVVFGASPEADFADTTSNVLFLDSAGLGLPDRDFYLEATFKDKLEAYRAHLGRMFELLGRPKAQAEAAAADVITIETALAKVTKTGTERRNLPALYNPVDRAGLGTLTKSIDWTAYFKQLGFDPGKKIIVTTPSFFQALDGLRTSIKPAQWANYFSYHLVSSASLALPKRFDDEVFALTRALRGVEQQRERYKRCVDATTGAMAEYVGQPFVDRAFPGASKQAAEQMVDAIAATMGKQFDKLDWMSDKTKAAARDKLARLEKMVGYPDKPKTYDYAVKRTDFGGNWQRATAFNTRRQLQKAGKPFDRGEWLMGAYEVNAYYNPLANNTGLPAGILQTPFFGVDRSVAANLGGIGMVIGHELTHGFDDQGAQFDAKGNMNNWWQPDDLAKFAQRGQCVSKQYATFEALPGHFVKGDLTLGENIADIGGVKMAYFAYRALREGADKVFVADGFTEDQQFFIATAQAWCSKDRKDEALNRLTTDVHSPPRFRVYGALRNLPEFARAFSCAAGQPMAPQQRCQVW